jgi:AcrR family transcriptional regulator
VQEICTRAGVSTGGLFRHFASREALMVAVGDDVGRQILAQYRKQFESLRGKREPLELALHLVRSSCRARLNQAWYELFMAARTNARLRRAIAPMATRYFADIRALAHELLPELAAQLGPQFDVLVDTIIAIFDGEAVHRFIFKRPPFEAERLELLLGLTRLLLR